MSTMAYAHANLAFVKYWGKRDAQLNLPINNSISMNLSAARTETQVFISDQLNQDQVFIKDAEGYIEEADTKFAARVIRHLDRLRQVAGDTRRAEVITRNNFPAGTGFASSASGMAALTLAACAELGFPLDESALSALARWGSGSASRSIPTGFVEWLAGEDHATSYAVSIAPPDHWAICDVAVIVSEESKLVSSSDGHLLAFNSPFWEARLTGLPERLAEVRGAILERDFTTFGRAIEAEALSMHAIMLTSAHMEGEAWRSGVYYWTPDTLRLLIAVQQWRGDGLPVYFTLDAGPTVHLICPMESAGQVQAAVQALDAEGRWKMLISTPAGGAAIIPPAT